MKPIAIHDNKIGFTPRWIEYCENHSIPFIKVNCYDSNIIEALKGCSALMWHWNYEYYQDYIFARQFLITLRTLKIKVFPDFWTTFLFDDKLGQKYLFESLEIPIPKTYVFYEKNQAINWAFDVQYPLVFKLRCGASANNVLLVKSFSKAKSLIKKTFSSGFCYINKREIRKERFLRLIQDKDLKALHDFGKSIYRFLIPKQGEKFIHRESGYLLFQEFLPGNSFDTRLVIVGNRCFGIRRHNRKNDFRASGSHLKDYEAKQIDTRSIKLSFEIAKKLETNLLVLDFLFDQQHNPVVTEISYGFVDMDNCPGYWDNHLNWHEGKQNLQYLMVEDLVLSLKSNIS